MESAYSLAMAQIVCGNSLTSTCYRKIWAFPGEAYMHPASSSPYVRLDSRARNHWKHTHEVIRPKNRLWRRGLGTHTPLATLKGLTNWRQLSIYLSKIEVRKWVLGQIQKETIPLAAHASAFCWSWSSIDRPPRHFWNSAHYWWSEQGACLSFTETEATFSSLFSAME